MAIKVWFVNGESVTLERTTLNEALENMAGDGVVIMHGPEGVTIAWEHVTHAEDLDKMPEAESSDWPG